MSFPPFFMFAVSRFQRRGLTIISLCLSLVMFYLSFLRTLTGQLSALTQAGRQKYEKASWCLAVTFKGCQLSYEKRRRFNNAVTSKHPKETTFNR